MTAQIIDGAKYSYKELCAALNERQELIECLSRMVLWHEKQSTWDKGDNGYYESQILLKNIIDDKL